MSAAGLVQESEQTITLNIVSKKLGETISETIGKAEPQTYRAGSNPDFEKVVG